MTNADKTKALFAATNRATANLILDNIANHYGITRMEAFKEVTHEEAENILDYVTGPQRSATQVIMQRHHIS